MIFRMSRYCVIPLCLFVLMSTKILHSQDFDLQSTEDSLSYKQIWQPFGPIQVRNQSAIKLICLEWLPDSPEVLPINKTLLSFAVTHSNHWDELKNYILDGEWIRYSLRFSMGVAKNLEFEAEYAFFWRGGGIMDGYIENFHNLFGITQSRRDKYPRDLLEFTLNPDSDTEIEQKIITNSDEGFGSGDLILKLKHLVIEPKNNYRPVLSVSGLMKVPIGDADNNFSVRAFEFGGHFTVRQKILQNFYAYLACGTIYTTADKIWGVKVRDFRWFWFLGIEWRFAYNWNFCFQFEQESGVARSTSFGKMLSWSTNLITTGIKWRPDMTKDVVFEFSFVENTVFHSNTPDIILNLSIHFGL